MACKTKIRRVTLVRVAEESNVSVTTASLILSGRPTRLAQFQAKTVDRVRKVADDLGYRANLFASSLLAARSSFFALVVQGSSHSQPSAWNDSVCEVELLQGTTETARAAEIYPVVVMTGRDADEVGVRSVERIMAGGVFGTIVRSPNARLETCLRKHIERGYPSVAVFPDPAQHWPQNALQVDYVAMGKTAGRLLSANKKRRWLLVRDAQYHTCQILRSKGCRQIAKEAGVQFRELDLPTDTNDSKASELLIEQIRQFKPDGIFGMTLRASVSSLHACRQLGMKANRDYALVGSGCAFWCHSPDPQITSLDVSWFDTGATAIQKLIAMAESGKSRFDTVVLQPRIMQGGTCRIPDTFKA